MRIKIKVKTVVMAFMVLLLLPVVSHALTEKQKALVGLKRVYVTAEVFKTVGERLEITVAQIQTDVELRLRKAGVRVLTKEECEETPGAPQLYAKLSGYITRGRCVYGIEVELWEIVTLARGVETPGVIWTAGYIGTGGKSIRNIIGDTVDKFINDYLAANPKK